MERNLRETMDKMGVPNLTIKRIGLTMDQIRELRPPPSIAKESSSRLAMYERETGSSEAWELDALPAEYLKELNDEEISNIVDQDLINQRLETQEADRAILTKISENYDAIVEWLDENYDDDDDEEDEY